MFSRTKLDAKLRLCEEVAADRCRIRVYIRQVLKSKRIQVYIQLTNFYPNIQPQTSKQLIHFQVLNLQLQNSLHDITSSYKSTQYSHS